MKKGMKKIGIVIEMEVAMKTVIAVITKGIVSFSKEVKNQSNLMITKLTIHDFNFLSTLGTGTFGRVRLVKFKHNPTCEPMALKMLK